MRSVVTYHNPDSMTAEARIAEIGRILSVGYVRLLARKSESQLEHLTQKSPDGAHTTDEKKEVA